MLIQVAFSVCFKLVNQIINTGVFISLFEIIWKKQLFQIV